MKKDTKNNEKNKKNENEHENENEKKRKKRIKGPDNPTCQAFMYVRF